LHRVNKHRSFGVVLLIFKVKSEKRSQAFTGFSVLLCQHAAGLPGAQQRLALEPAARGTRKVVVATNIAETSLTIEVRRTRCSSSSAPLRCEGLDAAAAGTGVQFAHGS
jgi:hypothetical protein